MKTSLENIGYEYEIDLKSMTNEEITEWGKNIINDNVILIRNQDFEKKDLRRIYSCFGKAMKAGKNPVTGQREFFTEPVYSMLQRVTNLREDGTTSGTQKTGIFADKELDWHSNANARDAGLECCVGLYCVMPGVNSVTSFCDTRQAYADLPEDVKQEVDNIECLFKFENNTFYDLEEDDKELEMFENRGVYEGGYMKPLVYTHPFDGKKGLYFSFHYIRSMKGNKTPMNELMDYLMEHTFQEKYIMHHNWKEGDFILMDQYHSLHKRNAVDPSVARLLYRAAFDYTKMYDVRL